VKFVSQNYYEILDVDPEASHEDVKRAFRLVRASFEPDSMAIYSLYSPEETEAIGTKIDEAFRILTDRDRRRVYDKYLRSTQTLDPVPDDPDEFFDNVHDIHELSALEELVDGAMDEATVARADVSIDFDDEEFDDEEFDGEEFEDEIEVPVQLDPELPLVEIEDPSLEEFVDAPADEQVLELPLGLGDPELDERASLPAVESTVSFDPEVSEDEPSFSSARLRSWSREYAVQRQNAESSFRLRPIDDRVLGEVRKARQLTGSALQRLRRERGIDLDTISERTKISMMYLRFIEGDIYDNLPAAIYLKGFVDQYATLLDLPDDLVDRYMEHYQRVCG
jgi:curved DNA-binding protein CbpA